MSDRRGDRTELRFGCWQYWLRQGGLGLSIGLLSACQLLPGNQALEDDSNDPYVAFTNAVSAVEPLINPELDALAANQLTASQQAPITSQAIVQLPPVTPLELATVEGEDMTISTSSELLSLNERLYQRFVQEGYSGVLDINSMTVSRAINQFCQQSNTVILTLSRPMTQSEQEACKAQGRQPVDFAIGKNAILLVVNPQNQFVQGVTLTKLSDILTSETWSDVDQTWPRELIQRRLIGPDSTTIAQVTESIFNGDSRPLLDAANTRLYRNVELMMQNLSQTLRGMGLLSYSLNQRAPHMLRAVPINGVTASSETIASGAYPLSQTLYLYADQEQLASHSTVSAWINFYLTHVNEASTEVNLFPLQLAEINRSKEKWLMLK